MPKERGERESDRLGCADTFSLSGQVAAEEEKVGLGAVVL